MGLFEEGGDLGSGLLDMVEVDFEAEGAEDDLEEFVDGFGLVEGDGDGVEGGGTLFIADGFIGAVGEEGFHDFGLAEEGGGGEGGSAVFILGVEVGLSIDEGGDDVRVAEGTGDDEWSGAAFGVFGIEVCAGGDVLLDGGEVSFEGGGIDIDAGGWGGGFLFGGGVTAGGGEGEEGCGEGEGFEKCIHTFLLTRLGCGGFTGFRCAKSSGGQAGA
ncbi:MAG: hypothetical protein RI897_3547 [Verrucomicrobiota bacterium]